MNVFAVLADLHIFFGGMSDGLELKAGNHGKYHQLEVEAVGAGTAGGPHSGRAEGPRGVHWLGRFWECRPAGRH